MAEKIQTKKLENLSTADATCRVESEILLPEYKEEAERIIRVNTKTVVKNKQIYLREHALVCEIEGSIGFHILYHTPSGGEKGRPSAFLHSEAFSHSFQIPCDTEDLSPEEISVFAEATPRSALVKLLGPRKLIAKSEIAIALDVKCNRTLSMIPPTSSDDVVTQKGEARITRLHKNHREEMSFSQTISLPKAYLPISEICEMEAVLFAQSIKAEDGGVSFLGLCDLHCSYTAEDENLFISFYQPIEFDKRVGIPELSAEDVCRIELTPVALKATTDINEEGENKNILFELDYVLELSAFETKPLCFAIDAFSTENHLHREKKTESFQELLGAFDFSEGVKGHKGIKLTNVKRAEGIRAGVEFRNTYLENGKICLEGRLAFSYLAILESDELKAVEDTYDFKTVITSPFSIPEGEECSIEVYGGARAVDLELQGEEVHLRFELCGNLCVYRLTRPELVCDFERGEALVKRRGEILFVYPGRGEDLWSLAKEYHLAPEKIKEQNHLTGDTLPICLKLIP